MDKRVFLIVLDSFGIGELPDAGKYGDRGSNTLAAVAASPKLEIPNLQRLGLYHIDGVTLPANGDPAGAYGRMVERSAGKDTTIGHWELAGVVTPVPLPTYPKGFPADVLERLRESTGREILCNKPYSGTQVLLDYGREHVETGALIVYTSADSVLQIAAHEEVVPVEMLYDYCGSARKIMHGEHGVGRIIARPFNGEYPDFVRTAKRKDFSLAPPSPTLLDHLAAAGEQVISIGKISDIFAGRGIERSIKTRDNTEGMQQTIRMAAEEFHGLCFVNLVDFDMVYGHRNDVDGYAAALTAFDRQLEMLLPLLRPEDLLVITADHGCDPSTPSTDHSREYVPVLLYGEKVRSGGNLGTRESFADLAATIQDYFQLPVRTEGTSFLQIAIN